MRVVIKIGSNVLINDKNALDLKMMHSLIKAFSKLYQQGQQLIIVTSGAVAVGYAILKKTGDFREVAASIGQAELIKRYGEFFGKDKIRVAQILLSPDIFKNRSKYDHLKEILQELIKKRIVPIINENDTVALKDTFGDNDALAAMVAVITDSNKLVFLTHLDGLYSADPRSRQNLRLIKEVPNVDLEIQRMCSQETSSLGRGGMLSKLRAAKLATTCGIETHIINGLIPSNIIQLLIKNKNVGTKFYAHKNNLSERKKWLFIGNISQGRIIVDKGARDALEKRRSLLAVGVYKVKGEFHKSDFVNIVDQQGQVFAFGLSNYDFKELEILNSLRDKKEIKNRFSKEIVHANNIVLLK